MLASFIVNFGVHGYVYLYNLSYLTPNLKEKIK